MPLNDDNLPSESSVTNDALDYLSDPRDAISNHNFSTSLRTGQNTGPMMTMGSVFESWSHSPPSTLGNQDLLSPKIHPEAYNSIWQSDFTNNINFLRNQIGHFKILGMEHRMYEYQDGLDSMDNQLLRIDELRSRNVISSDEAKAYKEQIENGELVSSSGDDDFNTSLNNFFYGGNEDALNQLVTGDMFTGLLDSLNEKGLLALNEDGMFKYEPRTRKELIAGVEEERADIQKRQTPTGGGIFDFNWLPGGTEWASTNNPVGKDFMLKQEASKYGGETVLSSIPFASYAFGASNKLMGDRYWRYQMTEDIAGTMSTFEGHGAAIGGTIVGNIMQKSPNPYVMAGGFIVKWGSILGGTAWSRHAEGHMEAGEARGRKIQMLQEQALKEIATKEGRARNLTKEEERGIRQLAAEGIDDMIGKNWGLLLNDLAQFGLTWVSFKGTGKMLGGKGFVPRIHQNIRSNTYGRIGLNATRYFAATGLNRELEGFEEGMQWKWQSDYFDGYNTNGNVLQRAKDWMYEDASKIIPAMYGMGDPDIYNDIEFKEVVQAGRDMGTFMTGSMRAGRGLYDYHNFRKAIRSLGKDGENLDNEELMGLKADVVKRFFERGDLSYLKDALYRAGRRNDFEGLSLEQATDAINEIETIEADLIKLVGQRNNVAILPGLLGSLGELQGMASKKKKISKAEMDKVFNNLVLIRQKQKQLEALETARDDQLYGDGDLQGSELDMETIFLNEELTPEERNQRMNELGIVQTSATEHDQSIAELKYDISKLTDQNTGIATAELVYLSQHDVLVNRKRWDAYVDSLAKYEADKVILPEEGAAQEKVPLSKEQKEQRKAEINQKRDEELDQYYTPDEEGAMVVDPAFASMQNQMVNDKFMMGKDRNRALRYLKAVMNLGLSHEEAVKKMNAWMKEEGIQMRNPEGLVYQMTQVDQIHSKYDQELTKVEQETQEAPVHPDKARLNKIKGELLSELYSMVQEPQGVDELRKRKKLARAIAANDAFLIDQLLDKKGVYALAEILGEIMSRGKKLDASTLQKLYKIAKTHQKEYNDLLAKKKALEEFIALEAVKMSDSDLKRLDTLDKIPEKELTGKERAELKKLRARALEAATTDDKVSQLDEVNSRLATMDEARTKLEEFEERKRGRDHLGRFTSTYQFDDNDFGDMTDDETLKAEVADLSVNYDAGVMIQNAILNNKFDDVEGAKRMLDIMENYNMIFSEKAEEAWVTDEFLENIKQNIAALKELVKFAQINAASRKETQYEVEDESVILIEDALGISVVDLIRSTKDSSIKPYTTDLGKKIIEKIGLENIRKIAEVATKDDKTVDKHAAMLMMVQMVRTATENEKGIVTDIKKNLDAAIASMLSLSALQGMPKPMKRNYQNAPINKFDDILKLLAPDRRTMSQEDPIYRYFDHRRLIIFQNEVEEAGERTDADGVSKKDLGDIIEKQINIVAHQTLYNFLTSEFNIINQLETEKRLEQAGKLLAPSKEQLIAIRELSAFLQTTNVKISDKNHFSVWKYLKGPAGTGKTQIVLPWALKSANISAANTIAIGHTSLTSKSIAMALGTKLTTKEELVKMIDAGNIPLSTEVIVIDEAAGLTTPELSLLAKKIHALNTTRTDKPIKVISLGDPNQIIEGGAFEAPITNRQVESVNPISVVYRTNIPALSNFQDFFKGRRENVRSKTLPAQLNAPNPWNTKEGKSQFILKGVYGLGAPSGSQVRDEILKRINLVKDTDTQKVIVTTADKVEQYQNLLNTIGADKVKVMEYTQIQGATVDEIYIDIPYNSQFFNSEAEYNSAIYMTTSRARNFVMIGNLKVQNNFDQNLDEVSGTVTKELAERVQEFKKEIENNITLLDDLGKSVGRRDAQDLTDEELTAKENQEQVDETVEMDNTGNTIEDTERSDDEITEQVQNRTSSETITGLDPSVDVYQPDDNDSKYVPEDYEEYGEGYGENENIEEEHDGVTIEAHREGVKGDKWHSLHYPQYGSVSEQTLLNGLKVRPIKHGDAIYVVKAISLNEETGKLQTGITLLSKGIIGKEKPGDAEEHARYQDKYIYRKLAVLGKDEIPNMTFLTEEERQALLDALEEDSTAPAIELQSKGKGLISLKDTSYEELERDVSLNNTLKVRAAQRLNYKYKPYHVEESEMPMAEDFEKWNERGGGVVTRMLETWVTKFYTAHQPPNNPTNLDSIGRARVRVYTDSDLKRGVDDINKHGFTPRAGIPYLVLKNVQVKGAPPQNQWIQLRPRLLSPQLDIEYLSPIREFIENVEALEAVFNNPKFKLGQPGFRQFMYGDNAEELIVKNGKQGQQPIVAGSEELERVMRIRQETLDLVTELDEQGKRVGPGEAQAALNSLAQGNKLKDHKGRRILRVYTPTNRGYRMSGKGLLANSSDKVAAWSLNNLQELFLRTNDKGYLSGEIMWNGKPLHRQLRVPTSLKKYYLNESSKGLNGTESNTAKGKRQNRALTNALLTNILGDVLPTAIHIERSEDIVPGKPVKKEEVDKKDSDLPGGFNDGAKYFKPTTRDKMQKAGSVMLNNRELIRLFEMLLPDAVENGKIRPDFLKTVKTLDKIHNHEGSEALGKFLNQVIYLVEGKEGVHRNVARHEIGHKIFNYYLTKKERQTLVDTGRGRYDMPENIYSDLEVEEKIFEEFMTRRQTGLLGDVEESPMMGKFYEDLPEGLALGGRQFLDFWGPQLRKIFKNILKFFGVINNNVDNIEKFFQNIDNGYFSGFVGEPINVERDYIAIGQEWKDIDIYMAAESRFMKIYTHYLYNANNQQKIEHTETEITGVPMGREEAFRNTLAYFEQQLELVKEAYNITDNASLTALTPHQLKNYETFSRLATRSKLVALRNELYTIDVVEDDTVEQFDGDFVFEEANLADHIMSAYAKDHSKSLNDEVKDFLNGITYENEEGFTKQIDLKNGYFKMLQIFAGFDSQGLNLKTLHEQIDKRVDKLGINKSQAGASLIAGLKRLVDNAFAISAQKQLLPKNMGFNNENIFIYSEQEGFEAFRYSHEFQSQENNISFPDHIETVVRIKDSKTNYVEPSSVFYKRIADFLETKNIKWLYRKNNITGNILAELSKKETSRIALLNIFNNTANLRQENMKVAQYQATDKDSAGRRRYSHKYFRNREFGQEQVIKSGIKDFIRLNYNKLRGTNAKPTKILDEMNAKLTRDFQGGVKYFLNRIGYPLEDLAITNKYESGVNAALKGFFNSLGRIGKEAWVDDNGKLYDSPMLTVTTIDSKTKKKTKKSVQLVKIEGGVTIEHVLEDQKSLLNSLAGSLVAMDNAAKPTSIKNVNGDIIYLYHNSSMGTDNILTNADGKVNWFHKADTPAFNHFYKYNPFVGSTSQQSILDKLGYQTSKIYNIVDLNGTESLDGSSLPTTYRQESTPEWLQRNFISQFLTGLKSSTTGLAYQYDQQLITVSDKPSPKSATIRVLKPKEILKAIKQMVLQHDDKQNINRDVLNYDPKRSVAFQDILNNGETVAQRAAAINEALGTHTQVVLDFINKELSKTYSTFKAPTDQFMISKFKELIKDGFVSGMTLAKFDKLDPKVKAKLALEGLVKLFTLNYGINSYFLNQMVVGDMSIPKDYFDLVKRMSIIFAPGTKGFVNNILGMKETFKVAVGIDPQGTAFDYLTAAERKKLEADLSNIFGATFDLADAQGYFLPERGAELDVGFPGMKLGRHTKPVYAGVNNKAVLQTMKLANVALTDDLVSRHPKLNYVRHEMRRAGVDEFVFNSGVKTGAPSVQSPHGYNTVGTSQVIKPTSLATFKRKFKIKSESIMELQNSNYRIQLDPIHSIDTTIANMSQLTFQINLNGENRSEQKEYYKITGELIQMGLEDFANDINLLSKTGQLQNYSDLTIGAKHSVMHKIRTKLIADMKNRVSTQKEVEMMSAKTPDGKYALSLNFPGLVNKVFETLSSHLGKSTMKFRFPGAKLTLQSNWATDVYEYTENGLSTITTYEDLERMAKESESTVEEIITALNAKQRDLKHITAKEQYIEVLMPDIYRSKLSLGDDVKRIYNDRLLGFRIPSTMLHSAVALKVVGFYDAHDTNTILIPKELTPLHGSDFDVDSLFVIRKGRMTDTDKHGKRLYTNHRQSEIPGLYNIDRELVVDGNAFIDGAVNSIIEAEQEISNLDLADLFRSEKLTNEDKTREKELHKYLNKLRDIEKAHKKNQLLDLFTTIIEKTENRGSMMTPISMANFKGMGNNSVFDQLTKDLGLKTEANHKQLYDTKNPMLVMDEAYMHASNRDGAILTGMFANTMKAFAYMRYAGARYNKAGEVTRTNIAPFLMTGQDVTDQDARISFTIDGVKYEVLHDREITKVKGAHVQSKHTVWDTMDSKINAAIDNAKEQILNILNITKNSGRELAVMIGLGIPLQTAVRILLQPSIKYIGSSSRNAAAAATEVRNEIEALLEEAYKNAGLSQEQLRQDLERPVKITTARLKKVFDKKAHKVKTLDQLDPNELLFQYQILKEYRNLIYVGQGLGTIAKELGIIQKTPATFSELEERTDNWQQLLGENIEGKVYIGQAGSRAQFHVPGLLDVNPHIKSALNVHSFLENLASELFPIHDAKLRKLSRIMYNNDLTAEFGESAYDVTRLVRMSFSNYLASSYYSNITFGELEVNRWGRSRVIGGTEAWTEDFIDRLKGNSKRKIEPHKLFNTNPFLKRLEVYSRRDGSRYLKAIHATGLTPAQLQNVYKGFNELSLDIRNNLIMYATLQEGLQFGSMHVTMMIPPAALHTVDSNLDNNFFKIIEDNQKTAKIRQSIEADMSKQKSNGRKGIQKLLQEQAKFVKTTKEYIGIATKIKRLRKSNAQEIIKMGEKLDATRSKLYNMYEDFRVQFMGNNGRFVPEYWKGTKTQLQTETIDNETVEVETRNPAVKSEFGNRIEERIEKNILNALNNTIQDVIYDIKIDKAIKPSTPDFLQWDDKNRVYIKIAETKPEDKDGYAYYQYLTTYKPGAEFYYGDPTLGETLYKRSDFFLPDVVSKPTTKELGIELTYQTNMVSKFARKPGDRIILRNYDDISRRDAKMYTIKNITDHWKAEQAQIRNLKEKFKALPLESIKAKRENLAKQDILNKAKLEKSTVRYTIDLENGLSLRHVTPTEDAISKLNMATRSKKGKC